MPLKPTPNPILHPSPILEFLAPRWTRHSLRKLQTASLSSISATRNNTASTSSITNPNPSPPSPTLTAQQRAYLARSLRINQAGELAATLIYASQTPPLARTHPHLRPLLEHMHAQEAGHLTTFNTLLAKHRIRPSALTPVWRAAASLLGWGTGLLGKEAAMACTEAVETEIGGHYNDQVRTLVSWERENGGEGMGEELQQLLGEVRRIRDEELEHLDTAVENDAKLATAWPVLTAVIRGGCRGAIWVAGRV